MYLVVVALTVSRHFRWCVAQFSFRSSAHWRWLIGVHRGKRKSLKTPPEFPSGSVMKSPFPPHFSDIEDSVFVSRVSQKTVSFFFFLNVRDVADQDCEAIPTKAKAAAAYKLRADREQTQRTEKDRGGCPLPAPLM